MKRLFDVLSASAGLMALWPIIGLCMLAVRLSSQGPALFAHTRVGRHGQPFTLYKLRTMERGTAVLPTHEVRAYAVTPIGRFLRRWKLDELPQLVNVLRGDMSLVGPRPCLPTQTELIAARRQTGALMVRPGITGLAQVRGIDMSNPVRLAEVDGRYAQSQTFLGDLKILVHTLKGHGMGVDRVVHPAP